MTNAYRAVSTPSGGNDLCNSGYGIDAESFVSVARHPSTHDDQVLLWVQDRLEADGIRMNESQLEDFVSEIEDDEARKGIDFKLRFAQARGKLVQELKHGRKTSLSGKNKRLSLSIVL